MSPPRVGVATEGSASKEVIRVILQMASLSCRVVSTRGNTSLYNRFPRLLRTLRIGPFRANHFLVVPDLHPHLDCAKEADRWNKKIRDDFPDAKLCFAIWETEAWLLADTSAVEKYLGVSELSIKMSEPDHTTEPKPSEILEEEFRRVKGYRKGSAFDKKSDGAGIAKYIDLERAQKRSSSLHHFLKHARKRE